MSRKRVVILALCVSFLLGGLSSYVVMTSAEPAEFSLPPNIYGLPLSKVWADVEYLTGVENSTAVLDQLRFVTAEDGSITLFVLNFYGENGGRDNIYQVEIGRRGVLTWSSSEISEVPAGTHPLDLLAEIEQIPFRELTGGGVELAVNVDSQSGDLLYDADRGDLYLLHDGELTPLNRVVFHSDEPWYDIDVCSREGGSVTVPDQETACLVFFTRRDIGSAETVEYADSA